VHNNVLFIVFFLDDGSVSPRTHETQSQADAFCKLSTRKTKVLRAIPARPFRDGTH
jgi:hypothetical protein